MARASVFFIGVILIAGTVACTSDGTPPYEPEIRDWHDLHAVRYHLGKTFILMNDLDATSASYEEVASETANGGKAWQPIGTSDDRFAGSFDGQGYAITDLFIKRPDESFVGLFGAVDQGGAIQNVGVVNASITGDWGVGGLVGGNWGNVSNSYSTGSVSGEDCVGGLVGGNAEGVSNSSSSANVTGNWDVGGLVGANDSCGTVSYSFCTGSVTGQWAVGGLLGGNWGGAVRVAYSTGVVSGVDYVGGVIGDNQGTLDNAYSTGGVTGNWYVGGLIGYNEEAIVTNCYSNGSVTGDWHSGGLIGGNVGGSVHDSFWDAQTSGMEESEGGTGKNTTDMQNVTTFVDTSTGGLDHPWDITAVALGETDGTHIWNIVDGQTYPFLSWSPA